MNPILKWALQILLQPRETSADESVCKALALVGIDASNQVQVNHQPLHSIFSVIGENVSVIEKRCISWQVLNPQGIVYPTEDADNVPLNIPELEENWEQLPANENLALALIEKYGTFLSISPEVPHVSFYDVVKSAAAIHDCLVCNSADKDKPFLLVSGDFSGIQEAIYTIASGGALKTLRARSFMLELLTEHIIYEIGQATGCGRYSLIFSGGGGFSLLVPNTDGNRTAIRDFIKIINNWMLEQFGLQLFLAVHCEPGGEENLTGAPFKSIWESMADQMAKQKQRKFWDTSHFERLFSPEMPKQLTNQDACWITHRDDLPDSEMTGWADESSGEDESRRVSKLAYRLWELGDRLTEFKYIFRLSSSVDDFKRGTLLFPTHDGCRAEYQTVGHLSQISDYEVRWIVNSWDLESYKDNKTFPFLFGSYVKSVDDLPKEVQEHEKEEYLRDHGRQMHRPKGVTASFSGLAKVAQGSDLIGCLRMDVDNFGDLFSGELVKSGIAALSNLSRSMNLFFKGYLNEICGMNLGALVKEDYPLDITGEKASKTDYRYVSIVYAGGDDLFIVGAWDDVSEVAFDINTCFREFSCCNPNIHLSGGVTLHKPKFPLYQMACLAKDAEEVAKANEWGERGRAREKESLSLFHTHTLARHNTFLNDRITRENRRRTRAGQQPDDRIAVASGWAEYDDVIQLTKQLYKFSQHPDVPHGLYRKLFETLRIWQEEGPLYMPMLSYTKYQFGKRRERSSETAELKKLLTTLFNFDQMRKLHVPLHWVEYLNRKGGED